MLRLRSDLLVVVLCAGAADYEVTLTLVFGGEFNGEELFDYGDISGNVVVGCGGEEASFAS